MLDVATTIDLVKQFARILKTLFVMLELNCLDLKFKDHLENIEILFERDDTQNKRIYIYSENNVRLISARFYFNRLIIWNVQ